MSDHQKQSNEPGPSLLERICAADAKDRAVDKEARLRELIAQESHSDQDVEEIRRLASQAGLGTGHLEQIHARAIRKRETLAKLKQLNAQLAAEDANVEQVAIRFQRAKQAYLEANTSASREQDPQALPRSRIAHSQALHELQIAVRQRDKIKAAGDEARSRYLSL